MGDLSEAKAQPQPADLMPSYPVGKKLTVELSFRFLIPAMLDSGKVPLPPAWHGSRMLVSGGGYFFPCSPIFLPLVPPFRDIHAVGAQPTCNGHGNVGGPLVLGIQQVLCVFVNGLLACPHQRAFPEFGTMIQRPSASCLLMLRLVMMAAMYWPRRFGWVVRNTHRDAVGKQPHCAWVCARETPVLVEKNPCCCCDWFGEVRHPCTHKECHSGRKKPRETGIRGREVTNVRLTKKWSHTHTHTISRFVHRLLMVGEIVGALE